MLDFMFYLVPTLMLLGAVTALTIFLAMCFRVVVPTNTVHIVQAGRRTTSYGAGQADGAPARNVYYSWPSWVPFIGVRVINLPLSVFSVKLDSYAAYDKSRAPFEVDILAFFRISDAAMAAQRVNTFPELVKQLEGILQGASRSILAKNPIEEILEKRAEYGQQFTEATNEQLAAWGVTNVKNIELMDIRDTQSSKVISNIMAMKQSAIEKESRVQVAGNKQAANVAEIAADQAVKVRAQEAEELVGTRTAQKDQAIGTAHQVAQQNIRDQEKITAEKTMAVLEVNTVRQAEITKQQNVVQAEQEKQVTVTKAEGQLGAAKLAAEAVAVQGEAKGKAETAVLMAPVNSQIALAKEIGENTGYQQYLVTLKQVDAFQAIGVEQAKALEKADVKIISNVGTPPDGVKSVMDLFTPRGAAMLGTALETIASTPAGQAITKAINGHNKEGGDKPAAH